MSDVEKFGLHQIINLSKGTFMKFILSIILMSMLSGCFYQSVNNRDIQDAIVICGKLENILEIRTHSIGHEVVECSNRVSYSIDATNLKGVK